MHTLPAIHALHLAEVVKRWNVPQEELFAGLYRSKKLARLRRGRRRIAPKSERPDAGIDKEAQRRERSAL